MDYRGFVMSDWWSAQSDVATAFVTDMMMPGEKTQITVTGSSYFGETLIANIRNGLVPEARVDDMVTRILAAHYKMGQDKDFPDLKINSWAKRRPGNWSSDNPPYPESAAHSRKVASNSTILLKNAKGVLPLKGIRTIAVIGEDAAPPKKLNQFPDRGGNDGTLAQGWGSGTTDFPYLVSVS
jgi:beta-glucosidase